jgi:hypothetical protein
VARGPKNGQMSRRLWRWMASLRSLRGSYESLETRRNMKEMGNSSSRQQRIDSRELGELRELIAGLLVGSLMTATTACNNINFGDISYVKHDS